MQIYRILNKITNKSYVGKSVNYTNRFKKHKLYAKNKINRRLYDSMNHHGVDNFELILLEDLGNVTKQLANEREKYWILTLNTLVPNGYNMTIGGDGGNTLENWTEKERKELYKRQGNSRRGKRRYSENFSKSAKLREANKTVEEKRISGEKISKTRKERIKLGLIVVTPTIRYGKDHPGWIEVDINQVLDLIKQCKTLKAISEIMNISKGIIRERLKSETGKNFLDWRHDYGIVGSLSRPRMV